MQVLTKLEIKKIRKSKATLVSLIIIFAYILTAAIGSILVADFSMGYNGNQEIRGMEAIKKKKEAIKKVEGYVDKDLINESLKLYKLSEAESDIDKWAIYADIYFNLMTAYLGPENYDFEALKSLSIKDSEEFYSMRVKRIKEKINADVNKNKFTEEDKPHIIERAEAMKTPIYYKYTDVWRALMENFQFLNIFIIIGVCLCINNVFTKDVSSKMWMIVRSTSEGKKKLAYHKIKSSILMASTIFIIGNMAFFIPLMILYGVEGWQCSIQIKSKFFMSAYNINFLQAYLIGLVIAYSVCIFMTMLTLLMSNAFKKASFGILSAMLIFFAPILVNTDKLGKHLNNFIQIMPVRALDISTSFKNNYIMNIGGKGILLAYIKPFILIALAMIMVPIIVRNYEKQEI